MEINKCSKCGATELHLIEIYDNDLLFILCPVCGQMSASSTWCIYDVIENWNTHKFTKATRLPIYANDNEGD